MSKHKRFSKKSSTEAPFHKLAKSSQHDISRVQLPRIKVVGVGGAGGNAVSRMSGKIKNVDFVVINTDAQDLRKVNSPVKVQIGQVLTRGQGAGMNPDIGRQAAEESREDIQRSLQGADMVFITAGMGGGTGTGGAPVVAEIAREMGALTIAVVTRPFAFEGKEREKIALEGWKNLAAKVDTIITIPNDRIFAVISRTTPITEAFWQIDDILRQGVQGISDLIVQPGLINVDFADVQAVMANAGPALFGISRASGENRAEEAARKAITSPLLDVMIEGAKGVLFHVAANQDVGMAEINDAAKIITEAIDPGAKVIFGATLDPRLRKRELKITVIATGFPGEVKPQMIERKVKILEPQPQHSEQSRQPVLQEVSTKDLLEAALGDDDGTLDIPAFLRRKK